MKKNLVALLILSFFAVPAVAAADSRYGIEPTLGQLLTRIAALQAIISHEQVNCAVAATKSTVRVGEEFTIAWGSYGADVKYSTDPQNMYPQNGEQLMRLDSPQIRTYKFTFFGASGATKSCEQTITVLR